MQSSIRSSLCRSFSPLLPLPSCLLALISRSFFIHFRTTLVPFLPPVSRSGFVCVPPFLSFFFLSSPPSYARFPPFTPFFSIFALNYLFSSAPDFLVWLALSSLATTLSRFRSRFTVFHCRGHLSSDDILCYQGAFLSRRLAISVNFR